MNDAPPNAPETLRLHQANERTMLAWVRTGIALMAFGFAIARFGLFLRELRASAQGTAHGSHAVGSAWLGVALVVLGLVANAAATVRYARVREGIERGRVGAPDARLVYLLGATLVCIGVVMTVLLARSVLG